LTARQARFLSALLLAKTIRAAARHTGVPERTAKDWLTQPAFKAAFRDARRRLIEHALGRLTRHASAAVETLVRLLNGPNANAAARAASLILSNVAQFEHTLDLQEQLNAFQARLDRTEAGSQGGGLDGTRDATGQPMPVPVKLQYRDHG
jgi:hypothetical protein